MSDHVSVGSGHCRLMALYETATWAHRFSGLV